ncbi:MAG: glucosyltransferase domain-containing protein [Oscillospiraceae bacterium]|nr:glucosyltransferase domain-containing protein [Oscillospiraceae bacterium]
MNSISPLERSFSKLNKVFSAYALPFFTCIVVGLLAYFFVFTNKLLNLDEISGLFKKGESISSGRWALWLSGFIFPDVSMPWIYGVLSLIMIAVSACITVNVFRIENRLIKVLLCALLTVFPSQIVTFSYIFTCAPYALALLMSVASVYFTLRGGRMNFVLGGLLMAFSLGIYQAYLSVAAALYVVYIIKLLIDGELSEKDIIRRGLGCIAALATALVFYFVINKLFMLLSATEYNSYADSSMNRDLVSLLGGVRVAYTAFVGYFLKGYYHLCATPFSQIVHIICLIIAGAGLVIFMSGSSKARNALLILCLALLPLAINCLYVVSSLRHTLMLYSFTALYVLAAVCAEKLMGGRKLIMRDALLAAMALVLCCNIVYANKLYLKMKLEYEGAYGFYQSLVSAIKTADGFDSETMVVITGDETDYVYHTDRIDTSDLVGIMEGLINVYSRSDFITYYIGFTPPPVNWDNWLEAGGNELIEKMPQYPYEGSIQKTGDYMIVKLG